MISRVGLLNKQTISLVTRNTINITKARTTGLNGAAAANSLLLKRLVSTVPTTHNEEQEVLVAQRKNRPVSPHLEIYQPQLTWLLSGLHRITGVAMAGAFYALTCTYAATSILNIPFDAATLVNAFASLPVYLQYGIKAAAAFPFAFHSFNGVRHLIWDLGKELTIKGVYRTGYIVLGATAVFGSYLAFFW
ncbi:succinate dehydrogenase [Candida orthopsilosis Co 90-125]|uniref:Succinate dehydrogenase n=1 Tax=Candida orthopsilosis (strain 90-125) TaxID=1136231 RepID=H8WYN8_CANO9|nr:succinate dehydrogenase [Candida orthopsilosis Co 90-125]CCG21353.1 succinate dehydrogenase [Candida orthopsilosis Co 90-125]